MVILAILKSYLNGVQFLARAASASSGRAHIILFLTPSKPTETYLLSSYPPYRRVVIEKHTGIEYACKSIAKTLNIPNVSPQKQAQHIDNIHREIKILTKLRATLSVAHLKGAWEDDGTIHIVLEYCRGGELHHRVGRRSYTEGTVAGYMRSVLQTIAQCHSHKILHRDIKPGNFMLLTEDDDSPLKAIDFGLAVFYAEDALPRSDLGLEGTAWFMAPEVLSSQVWPASDVWSAGVMAFQLLSGFLPFDDRRNPDEPALSAIWKGILTEEPDFGRKSVWGGISIEAIDFVKKLLEKDHTKRPTAREALKHPWLAADFHVSRKRKIDATVVQRLQRFAQSNAVKRSILDLIAEELLKLAPPLSSSSSPTVGSVSESRPSAAGLGIDSTTPFRRDSLEAAGGLFPMSPPTLEKSPLQSEAVARHSNSSDRMSLDGSAHGRQSNVMVRALSKQLLNNSAHGGKLFSRSPGDRIASFLAAAKKRGKLSASVHGGGEYWRMLRAGAERARMDSGHGKLEYLRTAARNAAEKDEHRKAARLALDTSVHGGGKFYEGLLRRLAETEDEELKHKEKTFSLARTSMKGSKSMGNMSAAPSASSDWPVGAENKTLQSKDDSLAEGGFSMDIDQGDGVGIGGQHHQSEEEERGRGRSAALTALAQAGAAAPGQNTCSPQKNVSFRIAPEEPKSIPVGEIKGPDLKDTTSSAPWPEPSSLGGPQDVSRLMKTLDFTSPDQILDAESLTRGLKNLGYAVERAEIEVLLKEISTSDQNEGLGASEFLASQVDWRALAASNKDLWLECARRAFADLDTDQNGTLSSEDLVAALRAKLPAEEIDFAVEDALIEAGQADADEVDFEGFLKMLRVGSMDSVDSLEQYDSRFLRDLALDASMHGTSSGALKRLASVPEHNNHGSKKA